MSRKKTAHNIGIGHKPDVEKPGKTPSPTTSKPVIVTNRPVLQGSMVISDGAESPEPEDLAHSAGPNIQPLKIEVEPADGDSVKSQPATDVEMGKRVEFVEDLQEKPQEKPVLQPETGEATKDIPDKEEPVVSDKDEPEPGNGKPHDVPKAPSPAKQADDEAASERAARAAEVQKLIDSKKYELPIGAVEKRKARHFVILGAGLAVLLALTWLDIALDAGLIKLGGLNSLTHFFSN